MKTITHHAPESLLASYTSGSSTYPFALVIAAHVSMCTECRAALETQQAIGGQLLESCASTLLSADLKDRVLTLLDVDEEPASDYHRSGIYPEPVVEALKGSAPRWKSLGMGVRQCVLSHDSAGSVRLLHIPPGQAVPDHGHNGLELTLVLQGSFSDETGRFRLGDLEVAGDDLEHTPIAGSGEPCVCLAATEAPLRFNSFIPRLLQPLFKI